MTNQFNKLVGGGNLKKGGGGTSGAPAQLGGVPLEKLRRVVDAAPQPLRCAGQRALDKAAAAHATGDARAMSEADQEMAKFIEDAFALETQGTALTMISASRRTIDRHDFDRWLTNRGG